MNPRLYLTASLLPLAALAVALAPSLLPDAPIVEPNERPTPVARPSPEPAPVATTDGPVTMSAQVDRDVVWTEGDHRVRVQLELSAAEVPGRAVPTDLVLVLDRSGSMDGEKMLDARAAARALVSGLSADDRFALVSFADDARVDYPLAPVSERSYTAIGRIGASGGTEVGRGLAAGLDRVEPAAGRARRVVLISDGRPNDPTGLDALAVRAARAETPLSAIGIGADYDEALMQRMADLGTGNFYWATRGPELEQTLASELSTARESVATAVVVHVGGGAQLVDAGGLPVDGDRASLGSLFSGQRRTVWLTLSVPPDARSTFDLGAVTLDYLRPEGGAGHLVADLPSVAITTDARVAHAALGETWERALVDDAFNSSRSSAAAAVQRGDREAAIASLRQYQQEAALANGWVGSTVVADNLRQVDQLVQEVEATFTGEEQASRRNLWSKGTRIDAYQKQRSGQVR
ncbi:MAG: VWA domain-containing protein [Myxococcota bacterium]